MSWWQRIIEWLRKLFGGGGAAAATVGCIDFSTMATGSSYPNPWSLTGPNGGTATFETINPAGSGAPGPAANNRVHTVSGNTGVDCNFTLEIAFPAASQLSFKLLHTSQPARIDALDSAGAVVGTGVQGSAQHVLSTVTISASGMVKAVVHSPADENILTEFCAT